MSGKTYTLKVSETELARVMFVMGRANGLTDGESVYSQACNIFRFDYNKLIDFNALHEDLGTHSVDYNTVQEEWEKVLGIGESKKSHVQQRIENLEQELDELKNLL